MVVATTNTTAVVYSVSANEEICFEWKLVVFVVAVVVFKTAEGEKWINCRHWIFIFEDAYVEDDDDDNDSR